MDMMRFKSMVEQYLEREQRSQAYLANRLGYQPTTFHKWMNGENRVPYEIVNQICSFFSLDPQQQVDLFEAAAYPLPSWVKHLVKPNLIPTTGKGAQDDVATISFNEELWERLLKSIQQARKIVCDLTWGIDLPSYSRAEDEAYNTYVDTIPEICKRGVLYREIMTFRNDPQHFLSRAELMFSRDLIEYNLRYFDIDLKNIPPLLTFAIVDEEEVFIGGLHRWPYLPVDEGIRLISRHPKFIRLFQDYFDVLWLAARPIKDGTTFFSDTWEQIKQQCSASGNLDGTKG